MADGSQVAALPVDVAELSFSPNQRDLRQGETLLVHAVLSGPEELADEQWRAGVFPPAVSVEAAHRVVPDFEPPQQATILVVIRNGTPEAVSLRGSKNQTYLFELTPSPSKTENSSITLWLRLPSRPALRCREPSCPSWRLCKASSFKLWRVCRQNSATRVIPLRT